MLTLRPECPDVTARLLLALGVGAASLAVLLVAAPPAQPGPAVLVPLLAALLLEATAPALPGFGFASAAGAGYLAVALLPQGGYRAAALLLAGGLLLRTLLRGRPEGRWKLAEALADLVPAATALAAMRLAEAVLPLEPTLPPLGRSALAAGAAAVAWLVLAALVPHGLAQDLGEEDRTAWESVRDRLLPLYLGAACGAAALAAATAAGGWVGFLVLPMLWGLQRSADLARFQGGAERGHVLEARAEDARQTLDRVRQELGRARADLRRNLEDHILLETFSSTLLAAPTLGEVVEATLDTTRTVLNSRSAVLFLEREGELAPSAWRSPEEDLLASAALVQAVEPVVQRAWESREPCAARPEELEGPRIFSAERSALAVPLAGLGVLYAGSADPGAYGPEELRLLGLVAGQASLALERSAHQESEQEALRRQGEAHRRVEGWARDMERLLEGIRSLLADLGPDSLRARLGRLLADLVPHDLQALSLGEPLDPPLQAIVDAVSGNRRPLLLDDVEGSRFLPPAPGIRSVLAVPLLGEGGPLGALVLGAEAPGAFLREHQDLLFLLGYQAAAAFQSAGYHQSLLEAYEKLKTSQAQLVQSSKMASVGQLAAGVAHELNTPLGAVILRLDGAARALDRDPAKARDRVHKAREAATKAQAIVAKLLYYSRDGGGIRREVRLDEVVRDTLEFVGHPFRLDGVGLTADLKPVAPVSADQNELQQVVGNLLLNARDASVEPGAAGRHVSISTGMEGSEVVLRVQDRGAGMTEEVRSRIFEPFFTTKPVGRGTGLGLSVSLEILRAHGGRLEVESEPGRGSTFTVRLPAAAGDQAGSGPT